MLQQIQHSSFVPLVDQAFVFALASGVEVSAELTAAEKLTTATMREDKTPFALIFRAPLAERFEQGMVNAQHPDLGTIEGLFLVPVREDEAFRYYEAVFN